MANLTVALIAETKDFITGMKNAQSEVTKLETVSNTAAASMGQSFSKIGNSFSGIATLFNQFKTAAGAAFIGLGYSAISMADAMDDLSKSTGFAIGRLLELRSALMANGGEFDSAARIIPAFSANLDQAIQGSASAQKTFERLGVSLGDLAKMSDSAIFDKVLEEIAQLSNEGKKLEAQALAVQMFGKAAKGIDFSGAVQSAEQLRGQFDQYAAEIQAGAELSDQLKAKTEQLQLAFLKVFEPFITQAAEAKTNGDKITETFRSMVAWAGAFLALNFFTKIVVGIVEVTAALKAMNFVLARTPVGLLVTALSLAAGAAAATFGGKKLIESQLGGGTPEAGAGRGGQGGPTAAQVSGNKTVETNKKVIDGLAQQLQSIKDIGEAYRRNNGLQIARLGLETSLIGATDTEKEVAKALFDARAKGEDQVVQLQKQRAAAVAKDEPRLVGAIDAEIKMVRQLTAQQLKDLEATIKRQQAKEAANRLNISNTQALIDLENIRFGILGETQTAESKFLQQKALWQAQGVSRSKEELEAGLANAKAIDEQTAALNRSKLTRDILRQTEDTVQGIQDKMRVDTERNELGRRLANNEIDINKKLRDEVRKIQDAYGEEGKLSEEQLHRRNTAIGEATAKFAAMREEIARGIEEDQSTRESFEYGWQSAIDKYVEAAGNGSEQARRYFETFAKGAEDALMGFVTTGKLSFRDLANSLIQEFARNEIRNLLGSLFGGKNGGGFGSSILGTLFGGLFANGGEPPVGRPSIVGERGPEMFIPRAAGLIVPNGGFGGGGSTNVTYNIQAADAASFRNMIARDPEFLYSVTEKGRSSLPGGRR